MNGELYFFAVLVALAAIYMAIPLVADTYIKFRGTRVITYPETRRPAAVEVDAKHFALTSITGKPDLRLKSCTRWPERQDCGQECSLQVELDPEDCLARNMLTEWYEGKSCVFCYRPIGEIHLLDHKPALMTPEGKTIEWADISPETIPEVLATHKPVCWNCHVAEKFRREHPEIIVDRSWDREVHVANK